MRGDDEKNFKSVRKRHNENKEKKNLFHAFIVVL